MATESKNVTLQLMHADSFEECMAWVLKHMDTTFVDAENMVIQIDKSQMFIPVDVDEPEDTPTTKTTWSAQMGGETVFSSTPATGLSPA